MHAASGESAVQRLIDEPDRVSDVVAHDLPVLTAYLPNGDHSLIRHARNYEWHHAMSETVQALLDAGLRLRLLRE